MEIVVWLLPSTDVVLVLPTADNNLVLLCSSWRRITGFLAIVCCKLVLILKEAVLGTRLTLVEIVAADGSHNFARRRVNLVDLFFLVVDAAVAGLV